MMLDKSHLLSNQIWKSLFIQDLWSPYFVKGNKSLVVMETWLLSLRNTLFDFQGSFKLQRTQQGLSTYLQTLKQNILKGGERARSPYQQPEWSWPSHCSCLLECMNHWKGSSRPSQRLDNWFKEVTNNSKVHIYKNYPQLPCCLCNSKRNQLMLTVRSAIVFTLLSKRELLHWS